MAETVDAYRHRPGRHHSMTIALGDGVVLELMREPRITLDHGRLETLVAELVPLMREAFGNDQITERDAAQAVIDVPYSAVVHRSGVLEGVTSAGVLALDDLLGPILYLGGAALASHRQGKGHYQTLLLTRFAIGSVVGAAHFTTRTQSPIVCRALKSYLPYPFTPGTEHHQAAARQIARHLQDEHDARLTAPQGEPSFDESTGVVRGAYGQSLYSETPWSGDADIDGYIRAHLSIHRGDALILVGSLRSSELDERCRRTMGVSFHDLTARVAPLVLDH